MCDTTTSSVTAAINATEAFYSKLRAHCDATNYYESYPLSSDWIANRQGFLKLFSNEPDPLQKVQSVPKLFSLSLIDEELTSLIVGWYAEYFKQKGVEFWELDSAIQ